MTTFPADPTARRLRTMLRTHAPAEVEAVARFRTRDGEFANLLYYSEEEYNRIVEWLTEPTSDFRTLLAYAGETPTRVGVAYIG